MHWTVSLPLVPPAAECNRGRRQTFAANTSGGSADMSMRYGEKMDTMHSPRSKIEKPVHFSQQLIAFTLYGTQKELGSSWTGNVLMLSSRVGEVTKHFPDIPQMFNFGLSTVQFGAVGVFCNQVLQKGTILGPFTGKKLSLEDAYRKYKGTFWEIHRDGDIKYCLDGSDPAYRNWMYFIQYARSRNEQNLIAVQYNENLFFKAERDIQFGEELLVWYDQLQYNLYMGIPQGFKDITAPREQFMVSDQVEMEDLSETESNSKEEEERSVNSEDEEEIEVEEDDDKCSAGDQVNSPRNNSENESETQSGDEASNKSPVSDDQSTCSGSNSSSVYPQLYPHSTGHSSCLPGFTTLYPLPSVQLPWVKAHQTLSPRIPNLPVAWPVTAPPHLPPSVGHPHKPPTSLDMFIRGVDGNRWQCQICRKIFTSQGSLRAHARIHTGERPYQCRFCKRTFTQASTLRSHERLHTGERPYKCKYCGKAFTQSAGLRSHLKTHMSR